MYGCYEAEDVKCEIKAWEEVNQDLCSESLLPLVTLVTHLGQQKTSPHWGQNYNTWVENPNHPNVVPNGQISRSIQSNRDKIAIL